MSRPLVCGANSWHVSGMLMRWNRSSRHVRTGSVLAWLSLTLALLQPYGQPAERWVKSDSGEWFPLTQLAGGLCLPSGVGESDGSGPAGSGPVGGIQPFCGLCIAGSGLTATLPDGAVAAEQDYCRERFGARPVVRIADDRSGDRPPVRGPPPYLRLS